MSLYFDSLIEKPAIIIDIGHAYTKYGFSGEHAPHSIIPTKLNQGTISTNFKKLISIYDYKDLLESNVLPSLKEKKEEEHLREMLIEFIYRIYYKILNANSRERKVVVVESILTSVQFRNILAEVLFKNFQAVSVLFIPSHLASIYTLGITTGLVLDCGYVDCQIMPIAEGVALSGLCDFVNLGAKRLHREIENLILKFSSVSIGANKIPFSQLKTQPKLTEEVLEDIKIRCCFVTSFERSRAYNKEIQEKKLEYGASDGLSFKFAPELEYNLDNNVLLHVPGFVREMAFECLFVDQIDSNQTLPNLILNTILNCPIDYKKSLAENVILIGGTCMLTGFKSRLVNEINYLLSGEYSDKLKIKKLMYHVTPSKENYTAWLGASIFGTLDILDSKSILSLKYKEMDKLPDWFQISPKREMHNI